MTFSLTPLRLSSLAVAGCGEAIGCGRSSSRPNIYPAHATIWIDLDNAVDVCDGSINKRPVIPRGAGRGRAQWDGIGVERLPGPAGVGIMGDGDLLRLLYCLDILPHLR